MKKIAYLSTYIPEEIIYAFGYIPYRIIDTKNPTMKYNHQNICSYINSVINYLIDNKFEAIILPNSCDSVKRLKEIISTFIPDLKIIDFQHPSLISENGLNQYSNAIKNLIKSLEILSFTKLELKNLNRAIELYNKKHELLSNLLNIRLTQKVSFKTINDIFIEGFETDVEHFIHKFEKELDSISSNKIEIDKNKIMIVGTIINDDNLIKLIEDHFYVAYDDLSIGSRYIRDRIVLENNSTDEIIHNLARNLLYRILPTQTLSSYEKNYEFIVDNKENIKGLVFIIQKFCIPQYFYHKYVQDKLKDLNMKSLFIEIEHTSNTAMVNLNRIELFKEMLDNG